MNYIVLTLGYGLGLGCGVGLVACNFAEIEYTSIYVS